MAPRKSFVIFSLLLCMKLCIGQVQVSISSPFEVEEAVSPLPGTPEPAIESGSGSGSGDLGHDEGGFLIKGLLPPFPFCRTLDGGYCEYTSYCYTGFHSGCQLISAPAFSQCPFGLGNCWLISCPDCPVCGVLPIVPTPLKLGQCPAKAKAKAKAGN